MVRSENGRERTFSFMQGVQFFWTSNFKAFKEAVVYRKEAVPVLGNSTTIGKTK
jgi:hypothetical protein